MIRTSFFDGIRNRLQALRQDKRGNVVFTFALAIIPIMGFVGAAVDFSRANSAKTSMQQAMDATALMLSKDIGTLTPTQMNQKATDYFLALFNHPEATGVTVTPTYTTTNGAQLVVTGAATVPTTFMKAMGQQSLAITVSSTIQWGNTRLRVALALDNTGSMSSAGKMTALKTATKNLLTQLKGAATNNGDVYVSIIPFSRDVNVGATNYDANWIDWLDWDADNGHDVSVTTCTNTTLIKNGRAKKKCLTSTTWVPDNHNTWNGCITDRDQDYDTTATAPNPADDSLPPSASSTLFPAEQYDSCPAQMMGLNYDWIAMNALVNQMSPAGNTNQAIGLAWAWQALVGGGPLTAPLKDPNYKYNDVIILLSDGLNTQDRWYDNQASIDARQQITCANVKAAGITLYTVHVNTDGDPTSTLLRNCASDASKFFILTSANDIITTFNSIGTQLSNLRVAR
jgi:Flp pilus assembly protein TadG